MAKGVKMASEDRIRELEDKYEGFKVYDKSGEKIGKVDDLFIDDSDREEYVGVKMGLFGLKSTLIPMDIIRVNEADKTLEVSESKDRVKDAPNFDDDEDITPDYENRIRSHFGLQSTGESQDRGSYGAYAGGASGGAAGAGGAASGVSRSGEPTTEQSGEPLGDRRETYSGEGTTSQSGQPLGDTGVTGDGDASRTGEHDRDYGEGATSQSGQPLGDTGVTNDGVGGEESRSDRPGERESRGFEETQAADRDDISGRTSGGESGDSGTREMPTHRETTETETFQEGGRTKIRRRIRREEVEFVDEEPNS